MVARWPSFIADTRSACRLFMGLACFPPFSVTVADAVSDTRHGSSSRWRSPCVAGCLDEGSAVGQASFSVGVGDRLGKTSPLLLIPSEALRPRRP